jgi:hypothetical protein
MGNTMAAPRRQRKPGAFCAAVTVLAAALAGGFALSVGAATTERIVVDRHSGVAISGYDPVAYFTDGASRLGNGEHELRWAGAVWRFRSAGNRGAFMDDPDYYMPRFGGYDPVGVARGVALAGDPRLWLLSGDRLYLFFTIENKALFEADSERNEAAAERSWPAVQQALSP